MAGQAGGKSIGFWTAVAIVVGNIIGSGVFLLPASLAPFGGLAFGGWLVVAAGGMALALVFARLAAANPAAGGLYAYSRAAFGDLIGFLVAWGYWTSVWSACAALAIALVGYLEPFAPAVARTPALAAAAAIGVIWLLTAVNLWSVRSAGQVQIAATILKALPLLVIGVAGLAVLVPAHFAMPSSVTTVGGLTTALMAVTMRTMWAVVGFESATIPAGAIEDPARTIPRATVTGTAMAVAVSVVSTAGVMGVVPPEVLAGTTAPFAEAARHFFGDAGALIVAAGGVISCFGALNGWILVQGQLPGPVANDGLFPAVLARTTARGTPGVALVAGSVLASLLVAMNFSRDLVALFTFVIQLSTLSALVPYAVCALALLKSPARGGWLAPILGFSFAAFAIAGAGWDVVAYGTLLLVAGLPIYFWMRRRG